MAQNGPSMQLPEETDEEFLLGMSRVDDAERFYEDEYEPTCHIRDPIDLKKLKDGESVEFEIDDRIHGPPTDNKLNYEEMINQSSLDAMGGKASTDLGDGDKPDDPNKEDEGESPFEELAQTMTNVTDDGGVKKKLMKQGVGDSIPAGAKVTVQYQMYCEYNDEAMDSTYLRERPYSFNLCDGEGLDVILGLDLSVKTMKKHEVSKFLISPEYAYGKLGIPPRIPPNATLLFQVELIDFADCGGHQEYWSLRRSERKECPLDVALKAAVREKECGREQFMQKHYRHALKRYEVSLRILQECRVLDEAEEVKQQRVLIKVLLNLALCCSKLGVSRRVISFCREAQRIDRDNPKLYYLIGKAKHRLADYDDAKRNLLKAQKLKPGDKDIAKELNDLEKSKKLMKLDEIQYCRKMFGLPSSSDSSVGQTQENQQQMTYGKSSVKIQELPEEDEQGTNMQKLTSDFENVMKMQLDSFADNKNVHELHFKKSQSYTDVELNLLKSMAETQGFIVTERGEGDNYILQIEKIVVDEE